MMHTLKVTTPSDREIMMTRAFDAPRTLIWDAMTNPDLIRRWMLGPPGWEMTVCENDVRVGEGFRHVWRGPDGMEMSMRGVYREVEKPERIVRTESFDVGCSPQAGEQVGTLELKTAGGSTTLTITLAYPSREARDATIASGMEHGAGASYDRLEELLATLTSDNP